MLNPKISVIIPIYNTENYLRKCLDSVVNQTYKDLEIICVNDATQDNCAEILEEYARKDDRIIILTNEKNIGLGLTRNRGLEQASGEYVHFLDSDDWMEQDAYEKLVEVIKEDVDVVCFLWNEVDLKTGKVQAQTYKSKNGNKLKNERLSKETVNNWGISIWHRLHRTKYLKANNLYFNNYPCFEDLEHSYKVLATAEKIVFAKQICINYRINNPNSLIGKSDKHYIYLKLSYEVLCKYLTDFEVKELVLERLLNTILYRLILYFMKKEIEYKELKKIVSDLDLSAFKNNRNYLWSSYYKEITTYPELCIKFLYYLRTFLKNNFRTVYKIAARIREKTCA